MAGLDAPSADQVETEDVATIAHNSRTALILFSIYLLLYGGFVYINAFEPKLMAKVLLFGVNVAILYGMGLILAALLLAGIYMFLCRSSPASPNGENAK